MNTRSSKRNNRSNVSTRSQKVANPDSRVAKKQRHNTTSSSNSTTSLNKSYHCPGCKKQFHHFTNSMQFIKNHMEISTKCKKSIHYCECCKNGYIDSDSLMRHLNKQNKKCRKYYDDKAKAQSIASSYLTSEVSIAKTKNTFNKYSSRSTYFNQNQSNNLDNQSSFLNSSVKKVSYDVIKKSNNNNNIDMNYHNNNQFDSLSESIQCNDNEINSETNNSNHQQSTNQNQQTLSKLSTTSPRNSNNNNIEEDQYLPSNDSYNEIEIVNFSINNTNDQYEQRNDDSISTNIINEINNVSNSCELCPNQNIDFVDPNHLLTLNQVNIDQKSKITYDSQYLDGLELVKLLMKKNISLSSYSDFMKFKHGNNSSKYYSIEKLIKLCQKRVYGSFIGEKLKPKTKNLICPSGRRVSIITTDIDAILYDLLSNKELCQKENFIFQHGNAENPFKTHETDIYDDIDQSSIYRNTLYDFNIDQTKQILCPIALYIDETTMDGFGKLSLHPVNMTLLIFNRKTRNSSSAWKTLGYIPNFNEQYGNKQYSPEQKMNDYHYCLRYILDGLEKLIRFKKLNWIFKFNSSNEDTYHRELVFYLSHVSGDAKGNDLWCSRYNSRTKTICIARDCDVKTVDSDNPKIHCNFLKMKNLQNMSNDELHSLSFRKVKPYNAFWKIDFGSNPYGINGATPADPLHQINLGIVSRLPEIFMARLNIACVKVLDSHVSFFGTYFHLQSDRSLPSIGLFKNGISSNAKLTAQEKYDRVYAIYITLLSSEFEKEIVGKLGRKEDINFSSSIITHSEYNQWINVFEEILILCAWVYFDKHPKVFFKGGRNSIVNERMISLMTNIQNVAIRQEGMGYKFLKWHQLLHLWWIIRMFASLLNVDTGRNESHHKKKKNYGRHTQRRIQVLDFQTATIEFNHETLLKGMIKANMDIPTIFELNFDAMIGEEDKDNEMYQEKTMNQINKPLGSKFDLIFDYEKNQVILEWKSKKLISKKSNQSISDTILQSIFDKLNGYNQNQPGRRIKKISGFTELYLKPNEQLFQLRCCPCYRNGPDWYDWCNVDWGDDVGILPCQILLFLDFNSIQFEVNSEVCMNVSHPAFEYNLGVLIHNVKASKPIHERYASMRKGTNDKWIENNTKDARYGMTVSRLASFWSMEDTYQLIDVESIVDTCGVYIDKYKPQTYNSEPGKAESVFVLSSKKEWHLHFVDYEDNNLKKEAEKRTDTIHDRNTKRYEN